jgi:hypothetical protein
MIQFREVNPENAGELGIFCVKNQKSEGFKAKLTWIKERHKEGWRMQQAFSEEGQPLGFIEYMPGELAWRPVEAPCYTFIQCMMVYGTEHRGRNIASSLLGLCEEESIEAGKEGLCCMASSGTWMAHRGIFEKNGFVCSASKDRFDLMVKPLKPFSHLPRMLDWEKALPRYSGWNLIYSDQCPWHEKSVKDIFNAALDLSIVMKIEKLETSQQARNAPSGFGAFSLVRDGRLLADHYISKTRFLNIVKEEAKKGYPVL